MRNVIVSSSCLIAVCMVLLLACGDDGRSGATSDEDAGGSAGTGHAGASGASGGSAGSGSAANGGSGGAGGTAQAGSGAGAGGTGAMNSACSGSTADRHCISGSVTASVATGVAMKLSGTASATVVPDARGVYHFDFLADGDYVVTPSLFGYTFLPASRAVHLAGADATARDFAAIQSDPSCPTGFQRGPIVAAGGVYTDLTVGDFDRDKVLDVVAIDGSGSASVFIGMGDATLSAPTYATSGDGSRYVSSADLNGDKKLDLIATAVHGNLSVMLGKGDGTFGDPIAHEVAKTGDGTKATLGDFDGDGKLDAAIGVTGSDAVAVLLGHGDGTFDDAVTYPTGPVSRGVTSADFNGDGKLDLACTHSSPILDAVAVLLGKGDGTFAKAVDYEVGKFPYSVVAGDWNGDGKPDLATANNNGTNLSVLVASGAGKFGKSIDDMAGGMPFELVSGDFDNDRKLDLVSANGAVVGAGVFYGGGDGSFGSMLATVGPASSVGVGDFDGDTKLDIAVAGGGGVAILRNCR